jgi:hypothetical protein
MIITYNKLMEIPIMLMLPITKTLLLKHTIVIINMLKMDPMWEIVMLEQLEHNLSEFEIKFDFNYIALLYL